MPFYLSSFVGSGTDDDPWVPPGVAGVSGWSIIDLRPRSNVIDGFCLLGSPIGLSSTERRLTQLADAGNERIPGNVRTRFGNRLGITLSASDFGLSVGEIMTAHATQVGDQSRWNPIRPSWRTKTRPLPPGPLERALQCWLGGELVFEQVVDPADHRTTTIEDQFGSMSSGDDLGGRTPSPTNTPGNTWIDNAIDSLESDGAGRIKAAGANDYSLIDSGDVDHQVKFLYNAGGAASNRITCECRRNNSTTLTTHDYYGTNAQIDLNTLKLIKKVTGTTTTLSDNTSFSMNGSNDIVYAIESVGTAIRTLVDGAEELTATDSAIDGTTEGGSFGGMAQNARGDANGRFDNFIVDDLTAGVLAELLIMAPYASF